MKLHTEKRLNDAGDGYIITVTAEYSEDEVESMVQTYLQNVAALLYFAPTTDVESAR